MTHYSLHTHKNLNDNCSLNESSPSIRVQLALGLVSTDDGKIERITPYVWCKDYLHDALYCMDFQTSVIVHGFKFNGKDFDRNGKNLVALVKGFNSHSPTIKSDIINNGFKEIENVYFTINTTKWIYSASDNKGDSTINAYIIGHPWTTSITMLSMFFTLIRTFMLAPYTKSLKTHLLEASKYRGRDSHYALGLHDSFNLVEKVLKNYKPLEKLYKEEPEPYFIKDQHNLHNCGIRDAISRLQGSIDYKKDVCVFNFLSKFYQSFI